jgi:hypothetical protein
MQVPQGGNSFFRAVLAQMNVDSSYKPRHLRYQCILLMIERRQYFLSAYHPTLRSYVEGQASLGGPPHVPGSPLSYRLYLFYMRSALVQADFPFFDAVRLLFGFNITILYSRPLRELRYSCLLVNLINIPLVYDSLLNV